jgi:hypothetical protein
VGLVGVRFRQAAGSAITSSAQRTSVKGLHRRNHLSPAPREFPPGV